MARIAGIIHLAEHGAVDGHRSSVGVETILAAERIGEYFKYAAINVFAEMGTDQVTADAVYLLERIRHLGVRRGVRAGPACGQPVTAQDDSGPAVR